MQPVDLGLSVLWCDVNLGADNPSGYGMYLSWSSNSEEDIKKPPYENHPQECISGNADYDPCMKQLGEGWRLPTKEEFEELINNCTMTRTYQDGVYGVLFTSKLNNKQIFLPAAGCKSSPYFVDNTNCDIGKELYYWSADFDNEHANNRQEFLSAYALLSKDGVRCHASKYNWTVRFSIRPIKDK